MSLMLESDQNGRSTDYFYANGRKLAHTVATDHRIHLSGTVAQPNEVEVDFPVPANLVFQTGDRICWQQYNHNATGGIAVGYNGGYAWTGWQLVASDGYQANQNWVQDTWQNRCAALDGIAGQTLDHVPITKDVTTPAGNWDILIADLVLNRADGTVMQFFTSGLSPALTSHNVSPQNDPVFSAVVEDVPFGQDPVVPSGAAAIRLAHYFVGDHLGTAQLEFSSGGWPVWQGQFTPYGGEVDQQTTTNHYKFTGKERDAETGLDYFGARYYGSNMGRWMSPDWADKPEAVPYSSLDNPQSLNLYGYVLNNPLSKADPDGHADCPPNCSTGNNVVDFFLGAGNAFSSDNLLGAGRVSQTSTGGQLGARLGDAAALVTGTIEVGLGALGEVGGLALDATGAGAVVGVPANVVSAGVIAHGATTDAVAGANLMFSKRTGDFTKGEKNAMDSKNSADNGGVNKCTKCGQEVQKVQNKAGEPTPGNQLQRHHDPPLSQRPPGTKSPNDRILCKDCHVQEHQS